MILSVLAMVSAWITSASVLRIGQGRTAHNFSCKMSHKAAWIRHVEDMAVVMLAFAAVTWAGPV